MGLAFPAFAFYLVDQCQLPGRSLDTQIQAHPI